MVMFEWFLAFIVGHIKGKYRFYETTMTSLLVPPVSVRGMNQLDRTAFARTVVVPCLTLSDDTISKDARILKKYLLKIRNLKPIQRKSKDVTIYLDPRIVKSFHDITEMDRELLSSTFKHFENVQLTLNYENWQCDQILRAVLPEGTEIPASFSQVGHIIHLNLRDVHLPYKNLIGQVYLDKVPNTRTVVNKISAIDTTFRQFSMEIIAGDKDTVTTVKEHGCQYKFDFAQVYWNPRLSTEHAQLLTFLTLEDVLYDVFAGVGPFSIPAARKGVRTFANDLNVASYNWLQENAKLNKINNKGHFKSFNMDGRDFLRNVVKTDILKRRSVNATGIEHIAMNLPASAIEFLDVLPDWFSKDEIDAVCCKPPIIHLYCFVKLDNKREDACRRAICVVGEKLGCKLSSDLLVNVHNVRNVSPSKEMVRVSFKLTKDVLKGEEPATKRQKIRDGSDFFVNATITGNNGKEQGSTKEYQGQGCIQSSNSSID